MLIDVIVPVYNGSAYIQKFFDMAAGQADDEVRFLFVDDGSEDNSLQLLQECAEKADFPVEILHQENTGVSGARNLGIDRAEASYIAFFDVDDLMSSDYVSVLKQAAQQGNFEVLVFASERVTNESVDTTAAEQQPAFEQLAPVEQLNRFLADPTRLGVVNLLIDSAYLKRVQAHFAIGYKYYEDYDFLYRVFGDAKAVLSTSHVLYYYVMREGSAMSKFTADRMTCLKLMQDLEPWLAQRVPEFAPAFRQWGCARIYWSVLWQAALAFPSFRDFKTFADKTGARSYLKQLTHFPDKMLQLSTAVFLISPWLYHMAVRMVGHRKSQVASADLQAILQQLNL